MRLDTFRRVGESHADLGLSDARLMWLFSDGRPRTLREIAQDLSLEQSTVNRQVNGALKNDLLRRRREAGRTAYVFEATRAGLAGFDRDLAHYLGLYRSALSSLPQDEQAVLLRLFARFVDGYGDAVQTRRGQSSPASTA